MNPAAICTTYFDVARLTALIGELSVPQLKAVLKGGGIKGKTSATLVSPSRRRAQWGQQAIRAISAGNDALATELLQQFLLHHRRQILIDYLDALEVKHSAGETDVSFLGAVPGERVRACAATLLAQHDPAETAAYLSYIAFQQEATVFEGWAPLLRAATPADAPHLAEAPERAEQAQSG
ncbi:MAG: hypothetical protein IPL40_13245 [Proteobacteria bacterium]|nr:hypothetical protein [Pseudomonadota bacterium]